MHAGRGGPVVLDVLAESADRGFRSRGIIVLVWLQRRLSEPNDGFVVRTLERSQLSTLAQSYDDLVDVRQRESELIGRIRQKLVAIGHSRRDVPDSDSRPSDPRLTPENAVIAAETHTPSGTDS